MLSIVIPTYNRGYGLFALTQALIQQLNQLALNYEIIYVDDGSVDDTSMRLQDIVSTFQGVKGIRLTYNVGQQNATLAGLRLSSGDYVITLDDDEQQDLRAIKDLVQSLEQGYDVVYGIWEDNRSSRYRQLGTMIKEQSFRWLLKKPKHIRLTSFRGMQRRIVDYVIEDGVSQVYISARILQYTHHISNVKVAHKLPKDYQTRYSHSKLCQLYKNILLNYSFLSLFKLRRLNKKQYEIKEVIQ